MPLFEEKVFITFHGWEEIYPVPVKNIVIRKISELLSNGNICVGEFIKKYYFTNPDYIIYGAANEVKYKKVKRKGAIYVGRVGRSLEYFKQYAKEQKIKLDIFTNNQMPVNTFINTNMLCIRVLVYIGSNVAGYRSYFVLRQCLEV